MSRRPLAVYDSTVLNGTESQFLLELVDFFDRHVRMHQWGHRETALATAFVLGSIKLAVSQRHGVEWYSLLHSAVTGYSALVCVLLNVFAAVPLTGTEEPLRSVMCGGSLTSLHRIAPAFTLGYGVLDIVDGFAHGVDFLLHGLATTFIMLYFCEYDVAEMIVPFLLMEISTVHLSLVRCDFFSEKTAAINLGIFACEFLLFRLVVCPKLWWSLFLATWTHQDDPNSQACLPWHFKYVVFCFGMFFNILNTFWGYKITLKIMRKLSRLEKIKHNNSLKEQ